jgi:hypothetical protein
LTTAAADNQRAAAALDDQLRAATGFEHTLVLWRHDAMTATMQFLRALLLSPGHGADDEVRLSSGGNRIGQRVIGRVMGQVPLAGEEPDEGTPRAAAMVTDGPAQHRVTGLQGVQH